jgi:hypothetical protein
MTVNSSASYSGPYTADGITTAFPFAFIAASPDEVAVIRLADSGEYIELGGYTVETSDTGGTVTFSTAPVAGDPIYLVSAPNFLQQTTFANQSNWSPTTMNAALDRAAIRDIALQAQLDQSLMTPVGEVPAFLPTADTRAGMFLAFDADGDPIATPSVGGADTALRTDLAGSGGSALVGFMPQGSGAVSRSAQVKLREAVSIRDFGAIDDGVTDNKAAILSALNSGAARILVPATAAGSIYLVSGEMAIPTQTEVVGSSHWGAVIQSTDLDSPIFSSSGTANGAIRNLNLRYSGTPVAGADVVKITNGQTWSFTDLWISSGWNGLRLIGGGNHCIMGYRNYSYENTALLLEAAIDVQMNNFRFHAGDSVKGRQGGIRLLGGVEAFIASDGDITLGKYGISTANTGSTARGSAPFFNRIAQVFFDSALNETALIDSVSHTDFVGCWFGSAGHDEGVGYGSATDFAGVKLTNSSHVTIIGGAAYNNGGRGVNVDAASKFTRLIGINLKRNGFTRGASTPGIEFAAGATDFAVTDCTFEKDADTVNFKQDVAVKVNTGASDRYFVADNMLGGCTVSDAGTGTNKRVANNY